MLDKFMNDPNLSKSVEQIRDGVSEAVNAIESNAREILEKSGEVVRKYPLYAMLGAMAVGFIVGSYLNNAIKNQKK